MPDRWPRPPFSSIAAVGFALNAYAIGVERGYVTRAAARARVLTTLRFLFEAQQGTSPDEATGYQGFFYHFVNFSTGRRYGDSELSTVDTALLIAGVLFVGGYFDQDQAEEVEIRRLADELYKRVNWPWAMLAPDIRMAWSPELKFGRHDWRGYNEAMLVFVLALGSPTYPAAASTWVAWTSEYYRAWGTVEGQTHLTFGPMFGHQYTHIWIDLRGIKDEFMWPLNMDYFENSRRAVLSPARLCDSQSRWTGAATGPTSGDSRHPTGPDGSSWTISASRGSSTRTPRAASACTRPMTTAPSRPPRPSASLPFAPEVVLPAIHAMHKQYGRHIYGKYGFVDAFNPSFDYDVPLRHGRRVRGVGWVDDEYLGIDQGPIISMIENYRSELIWSVMKRNQYILRGLEARRLRGRLARIENGDIPDLLQMGTGLKRWRAGEKRARTCACGGRMPIPRGASPFASKSGMSPFPLLYMPQYRALTYLYG